MKEIVPIVYASDENFLLQTYVSIYSVLTNRKNDYYLKFFILVPENCQIYHYNTAWSYDRYSIEYIKVLEQYFQNTHSTLQNITKPTFYRLIIPLLLPQYKKCVYLDGDTVCCNDILKLYDTDLENNYFAASKGAIINFNKLNVEHILDIPDAENYVNAGVLIMNLELMRQKNMVEKFMEYSVKGYPCQDQDVLNKCCYGKIKILPMKNNVYCNVFSAPENIIEQRFDKEDIAEARNNPTVIHYPREYSKPWKNINAAEGYRWWNYAEQAIDKEKLVPIKKDAENWLKRYDYFNLQKRAEQCTGLVIFGYSEIGCRVCDGIIKKYPEKIRAFCDNDQRKQGLRYKSYRVISIEQLKAEFADALIIITSQNYSNIIKNQLIELGFEQDKIVIYRKKTIDYFYSFQKSSFDEVCKDILLDDISLEACRNDGVDEIRKYVKCKNS